MKDSKKLFESTALPIDSDIVFNVLAIYMKRGILARFPMLDDDTLFDCISEYMDTAGIKDAHDNKDSNRMYIRNLMGQHFKIFG